MRPRMDKAARGGWTVVAIIAALAMAGCGKPGVEDLRESFAQQLASNRFIQDFRQSGEDLLFSGPRADGGVAQWRVHIDSAVIEPNSDARQPYKGVVKASWYMNDRIVQPSGRDSNLPLELTGTGLAQECWALWDKTAGKWGWE